MTHIRLAALGLAGLALTACDSPTPPTITLADVRAAEAEFTRIEALPRTTGTGSATYGGNFYADTVIEGDDFGILGDMRMNVNFAGGPNSISGTIDNLNTLDENDVPEQFLEGFLRINGSTTFGGGLSATAEGEISGVGEKRVRGDAFIRVNMTGDVRADGARTAVFGDNVSGGSVGDGDFDVFVRDGAFFGTETD